MNNNLAYIDPIKCKLCRKCVDVCPTDSILEINFPVRKKKPESEENVVETKKSMAVMQDTKQDSNNESQS
jgi:formate hydrogenlyase subunit 6/NADH:ubiquinone oxidoreductase subunit I